MNALLLKKVSPVTVRDQLASHLREAILRGQLRPGQRLVERAIAESTGTSQASVREALQVLDQEGLVTKKINAASFVTDLSAARLRDILSVRLQLEPYAVGLASQRLSKADTDALRALVESIRRHAIHQDLYTCSREDFEFHRRLWQASGHELLSRILTQICTSYFAYTSLLPGLSDEELDKRFGSHELVQQRWRAGLTTRYEQHRQVLDVVLSRNRQAIETAVRKHIRDGWLWLLQDDRD